VATHHDEGCVQARQEGICSHTIFGHPDRLTRIGQRLEARPHGRRDRRHACDKEQGRRATYAKHLAEKRARQGYTFEEAYDKMYERNYFGMSMVEQGAPMPLSPASTPS
jgi:malate dehydrogenase (oxaloacetate-decarboxylating)(NADP+)